MRLFALICSRSIIAFKIRLRSVSWRLVALRQIAFDPSWANILRGDPFSLAGCQPPRWPSPHIHRRLESPPSSCHPCGLSLRPSHIVLAMGHRFEVGVHSQTTRTRSANILANVRDQVSLLASGAEGAQATSVTEVPKGQGLTASLCSHF